MRNVKRKDSSSNHSSLYNVFPPSQKSRIGLPELEATFDTIVDAYLYFDKDKDGYVSKAEIVSAINESSSGKKGNDQIGVKRFGLFPVLLLNAISLTGFQFLLISWTDLYMYWVCCIAEEMDWDKDGKITFKEFLFAFTNWVGVKDNEDEEDE